MRFRPPDVVDAGLRCQAVRRRLVRARASDVDATAVLFPVAVSGRVGSFPAADFARRRRGGCRLVGLVRWRLRLGGLRVLAYHSLGLQSLSRVIPIPMNGKMHATDAVPFAIDGYGVLELSGRDAAAFLH